MCVSVDTYNESLLAVYEYQFTQRILDPKFQKDSELEVEYQVPNMVEYTGIVVPKTREECTCDDGYDCLSIRDVMFPVF